MYSALVDGVAYIALDERVAYIALAVVACAALYEVIGILRWENGLHIIYQRVLFMREQGPAKSILG